MTRIRIAVLLARPPVVLLLALFAAVGQVQAAGAQRPQQLAQALIVVMAYLVFSVAVNDIADVAVDRVNLPGDRRRPLAAGLCAPRDMAVVAGAAAVVAVAGAALLLHGPAVPIVLAGLAVSAAYSLPPWRLAKRGAIASLVLPAAYVVVPYCAGALSVGATLSRADGLLLGGLYVGFIGRILLKDFRDVRGDSLFGKRTFLVRHGRRATCAMSATFWMVGSVVVAAVGAHRESVLGFLVLGGAALVLLRMLAIDGGPRRDERLVSAVAIVGRGTIVTLLAHLTVTGAHWAPLPRIGTVAGLVAVVLGLAHRMAMRGPGTRLRVPSRWRNEVGRATYAAPAWTSPPR